MHVPTLLAITLCAATTAQARHMRATRQPGGRQSPTPTAAPTATEGPKTTSSTPTPQQQAITRAPDPNKALPQVYTVSVSGGSAGASTTIHCDNVLCTDDSVWCWYWGGITGYDVGLGPLPGETITVLGLCSDYDQLGEDYEEEAEFEW
ncbi:hypothetical protein DL766_005599 [Monosporascus sp. MC13-8B]|uniref:Ig-like domain-containing protein n=1 Tax=Monosporascus cannonballus TaxID=155416 RepID=A0ABY0GX13_9PEZI|nr:hypothetical protein DL763_010917 [Monosporascus cannonballus]RYO79471.1 hypothetical protein DL762_008164 [Monosporascus cannonballus]RYP28985.1 hypothetical protein DL766_005599 [Monosporascus sp. MC13-8B]